MYFKRIDLQGFKSFADPVSIEFHDGITCIVGPNGSGKSNISDALRWVLGEQSPKMLRGGKMEEVIFAGTANRKSRGMAEVTLVIDNSTGILPIDYSEVAITRRMYRSGESEYAINNTACRLRDIRELIMDTGIGVDGYSIIGQGKISEIVSNKPESRREIFEEAAGIVKYRSRKAEAERKLDNSNANLERVNDIIGEIESRIGGLAEDSRKAAEFLKLRDRQKDIEINITLKNIESVELKNEYLKDELTELSQEVDSFKERKAKVEADLAENRQLSSSLDQQEGETRDLLLRQVEEIHRMESQAQLNQERLQTIERENARLQGEIIALQDKLAMEENNGSQLAESREQLIDQLSSLQEELREALLEQKRRTDSQEELARQIEDQKDKIYSFSADLGAKRSELAGLSNLRETLVRRKEQLLSDAASASEGSDQLLSEKDAIEKRIGEAQERQRATAEEGSNLRQSRDRLREEEKQYQRQLEELRISIGQTAGKQRMFQDLENSYDGYNGAVKFIMRQNLPGIVGLVAELIQVPQGFETAVETALGAALQNVVCEDDHSAQQAVTLLKKSRAGRLTFLPVKSIRGGKSPQAANLKGEEGYLGLGADCVTFDSRYANIVEYLLGRVVIVDRLEHAVRMSKRVSSGLRFVTLEGEVINASGAITGGMYKTNSANLLSRKSEIQQLSQMLSQLQEEKQSKSERLEQLQTELREADARLEQLTQQYRDGQLSLMEQEKQMQILSAQQEDMSQNSQRRERELQSLEQEEGSADAMMEQLSAQIQEQKRLSGEAEALLSRWIPQLEEARQELASFGEEVTKLRMEAAALENRRDSALEMERRIAASIRDLTSQQEDRRRQLQQLAEEKQQLLSGDGGLLQGQADLQREKEETEKRLARLQQEKADTARYLEQEEQRKSEMDQQLFAQQQKKYDVEVKLAKNETQISSWKDKLWEDFEISYLQAMEFEKTDFVMSQALRESREIRAQIKALGDVNVGAIKEYETTRERYEFLNEQRDDLLAAMTSLKQIIDDMDKTIRQNFKESFDQIMVNFEETFTQLFGGGTARLQLEDESRPLESGIEIVAQPPGKKLQNLNLMSGGEKTMTAIALMFAVLKTKPTPFCILDEVEAALDEANIDRFARYLKNFEGIQFALVTHQKATMEYADVLYGVTMPEQGISKVLSLRLGDEFDL